EPPRPRAVRGGAAATWAPGATVAPAAAERTMTADSMDAIRKEVRDKAAQEGAAAGKGKKGASWVVWLLAFVALGGIGFGVAWLVLNPPGGEEPAQVASAPGAGGAEEEAAADASEAAEDAAAPGEGDAGEGEVSAAAASDAGEVSAAGAADVEDRSEE